MSNTTASEPRLYGRITCSDTQDARLYLDSQSFAYQWIDIDEDEDGRVLVRELNGGFESTPVLVLPSGHFLTEPSAAELAELIG